MPERRDRSAKHGTLRSHQFRTLWLGDASGRTAFTTLEFALPLVAITRLDAPPIVVGILTAAQFLPVLCLSLWAGAITARFSARAVLILSNAVRLFALIVLLVLGICGILNVAILAIVAFVVGCATVFYEIAFQTAVPSTLTSERLVAGNSLVQATSSLGQLAGPAAVGFMLEALGVNPVIALLTFLFGAGLMLHRRLRRSPAISEGTPSGGAREVVSIRDGIGYVWRSRPLRTLCLQSALFNLHEQAFATVFLIAALRFFDFSNATVGLVFGAGSLGVILGAAGMGRVGSRLPAGPAIAISLVVAGGSYLIGALVAGLGYAPIIAFGLAFLANGLAVSVFNVFSVSIRQTLPPPQFLPAAMATYRMLSFGAIPVGAILGGILVTFLSPQVSLVLCCLSMVLFALPILGSRLARIQDLPPTTQESAGPAASARPS